MDRVPVLSIEVGRNDTARLAGRLLFPRKKGRQNFFLFVGEPIRTPLSFASVTAAIRPQTL